MVVLFSFTNGAYKISCGVLCCEVFKFWVKDLMDYGTRSSKSLSLGIPMEPQDNLRTPKIQSLGMPRKASPLSPSSIGNFSVEFCVVNFQVLGKDLMDYGIRSGKSLSLGMPKEPQDIQG